MVVTLLQSLGASWGFEPGAALRSTPGCHIVALQAGENGKGKRNNLQQRGGRAINNAGGGAFRRALPAAGGALKLLRSELRFFAPRRQYLGGALFFDILQ